LAAGLKLEYDAEGKHAASGTVHAEMLVALNDLPFYKKKAPKSLGKEWVFEYFIPVIEKYSASTADTLATVCEHVALQISAVLQQDKHKKRMLLTGGGAFNTYLVERIRKLCITDVLVPDPITINYKEALIFAFLGVLRIRNEINSLKSVTGAERDSIGGTIYQG
jgi:anhydro-N-acetylmuramic acid kinase